MTIGLYDTFANPQGCHIIRGALYTYQNEVYLISNPARANNAVSLYPVSAVQSWPKKCPGLRELAFVARGWITQPKTTVFSANSVHNNTGATNKANSNYRIIRSLERARAMHAMKPAIFHPADHVNFS